MPVTKTLTVGGNTYDFAYKTSDLTNDSGFVDAAGAAAAAPVQSVNGQTGAVVTPTEQDIADAIIQVLPVDSASGAVASFPDGYPAPVEALSCAITPVQSGSGTPAPDNVRPISGWSEAKVTRTGKNLFDKSAVATGKWLSTTTGLEENTSNYCVSDYIPVKSGQTVFIPNSGTARRWFYDKNKTPTTYLNNSNDQAYTPSADGYIRISILVLGSSAKDLNTYQVEVGSSASAYAPYTAQTVTIDLDGTRYGGTLDVLTGVLTVTQEAHVLTNTDGWIGEVSAGTSADGASYIGYINKSGKGISTASGMFAMSSAYKFIQSSGNVGNLHKGEFNGSGSYFRFVLQDGITTLAQLNTWLSSNPVTLVYELASPISVQLSANELSTLLGQNNVWANCGDVSVSYRADIQRYIDKKLS